MTNELQSITRLGVFQIAWLDVSSLTMLSEMTMKAKILRQSPTRDNLFCNDNNACSGLQGDHLLTSWIIPFNFHKNSMTEEDIKGQGAYILSQPQRIVNGGQIII